MLSRRARLAPRFQQRPGRLEVRHGRLDRVTPSAIDGIDIVDVDILAMRQAGNAGRCGQN